jgi:hypothetical protein
MSRIPAAAAAALRALSLCERAVIDARDVAWEAVLAEGQSKKRGGEKMAVLAERQSKEHSEEKMAVPASPARQWLVVTTG